MTFARDGKVFTVWDPYCQILNRFAKAHTLGTFIMFVNRCMIPSIMQTELPLLMVDRRL